MSEANWKVFEAEDCEIKEEKTTKNKNEQPNDA